MVEPTLSGLLCWNDRDLLPGCVEAVGGRKWVIQQEARSTSGSPTVERLQPNTALTSGVS